MEDTRDLPALDARFADSATLGALTPSSHAGPPPRFFLLYGSLRE
jgi:hypothetical protein